MVKTKRCVRPKCKNAQGEKVVKSKVYVKDDVNEIKLMTAPPSHRDG